jgi:hypothetical protein
MGFAKLGNFINLSMKCINSAFNAEDLRVFIVVVQVKVVKITGKIFWVPITLFYKIFIPSYFFAALYPSYSPCLLKR